MSILNCFDHVMIAHKIDKDKAFKCNAVTTYLKQLKIKSGNCFSISEVLLRLKAAFNVKLLI